MNERQTPEERLQEQISQFAEDAKTEFIKPLEERNFSSIFQSISSASLVRNQMPPGTPPYDEQFAVTEDYQKFTYFVGEIASRLDQEGSTSQAFQLILLANRFIKS